MESSNKKTQKHTCCQRPLNVKKQLAQMLHDVWNYIYLRIYHEFKPSVYRYIPYMGVSKNRGGPPKSSICS